MPDAGWYEPEGGEPGKQRYWDGEQWTNQTRPTPGATPPPPPPPPSTGDDPVQFNKPKKQAWYDTTFGRIVAGAVGLLILIGIISGALEGDDPAGDPVADDGPTAESSEDAAPDNDETEPEPTEEPSPEPELIAVPDATGLDPEEALGAFADADLTASIREVPAGLYDTLDVVGAQDPAPGEEVEAGTEVSLLVAVTPFEPALLEGSGDDVVDIPTPQDQPSILLIEHSGGSNFAVISYDTAGDRSDLLVNTIGAYSGMRPINVTDNIAELEIQADGSWTVSVEPLRSAPRAEDGAGTGTGDQVLILPRGNFDSGRLNVTHSGESNFAVIAISESEGRSLLINEIGNYEGTVRLPDAAFFLDIQADGDWTIAAG